MSRVFTVSSPNGGVTIVGGAEILRCSIGQDGTDVSEQQEVNLFTQVTAFPTLTSATPTPHLLGETSRIVGGTAGAAGTAGIDASAEGGGAKTVILADGFNNLNGWLYIPTPEERIAIRASASSGFGMRLASTPTTLSEWHFSVTYREL
jgi:hypothetical protein